jgi:AraC-like DNA-binding protein
LLDTAYYYFGKRSTDTALVCFSLIINTTSKDADFEQQKRVIEAYNKSGVIYCQMYDYRTGYEHFIKALLLCEKYNAVSYQSNILLNIGHVYYHFNKFDIATSYCMEALKLCQDSVAMVLILNNLGASGREGKNLDSVFYFLTKSLQISKRHDNVYLYNILNNFASLYEKSERYDSAFSYYHLALEEARKNNVVELEAENLMNLSQLFLKINKIDSALRYIDLSNAVAKQNNLLNILAENHLTLSKIEESKGLTKSAFAHYKTYVNLKDSIFNVDKFAEINQLQRLYEVSKTDQQIEQLVLEQRIKERTIHYQRIIQMITWVVLIFVSAILMYIFFQKKNLNKAYKALFEKNIEIINLQENSLESHQRQYKKIIPSDDLQNELVDKILTIMEDTSVICDAKFSMDRLSELVQSNQKYVSQVINTTLKKNFRSFLNEYRIREAQRLFSELDTSRYTIDSVALQVGFKSPSGFRTIFKEITGVSPNFYLQSIREYYKNMPNKESQTECN